MKRNRLFALVVSVAVLLGCTQRDERSTRSNPFDAGGTDFSRNQAPAIESLSILDEGLWYDFDFEDSTGTLLIACVARDRNEYYDTLHYLLYAGGSPEPSELVDEGRDTLLTMSGVDPSRRSYYRVAVTDQNDTTDTTGSVVAPAGVPPRAPREVEVRTHTAGVRVLWSRGTSGTSYRVYRADSPAGPFVAVHDTLWQGYATSSTISWFDSLNDHAGHLYRVAARNEYGQSLANDTLWGWRYYDGLSAPSISYVSKGTYAHFIRLSWYGSSNSSDVESYLVYRADSTTGSVRQVGTVVHDGANAAHYFNDTVPSNATYCYALVAVDNQGRSSRSSSFSCGYRTRLSAPPYLSASDGLYRDFVYVSWYSVSGAAGYYLYRRGPDDTGYVKIDSTGSTIYRDTVPTTGSYSYRVSAYTGSGEESPSSGANAGYCHGLDAPVSVLASDGVHATHVRVTWSEITSAAGYYVYRSRVTAESSFVLIDSTEESWYHDSSVAGGMYYYRISAYTKAGLEGALSNGDGGSRKMLPAPASLSASDGTYPSHVALQWTAVTGAEGYEIRRSTKGSDTAEAVLDSTTDTLYRDSSTREGVVYRYRVAAFDERGTGAPTAYEQGRQMSAPHTPRVSSHTTHLTVGWDRVSYAEGYYLYRSRAPDSGYTKIAETSTVGRSFEDTVEDHGLYYYTVAAYNDNGVSPESPADSGARKPEIPDNLTVTDGIGHAVLRWRPVDGAEGYQIYRRSSSIMNYTLLDTATDTFHVDSVSGGARYMYRMRAFTGFQLGSMSETVAGGAIGVPCSPYNFYATSSGASIGLKWQRSPKCSKADRFYIYRGTTTTAPTRIDSTDTTVYVDSLIEEDTLYYWVSGVNVMGEGEKAGPKAGWAVPPPAPSILMVDEGEYGSHIPLSWPEVRGADGYYLYRSVGDNYSYSIYDTTANTTYADSAVETGSLYYYRLRSYSDMAGASTTYGPAAHGFVLPVPDHVRVTGDRAHIEVAWSPVHVAAGYIVYRATSPDEPFELVDSTTSTSFLDSVESIASLYYRVTAYRTGESAPSAIAGPARRLLPETPTGVEASKGEYVDSIRVWWNGSAGADGYRVYRDEEPGFGSPVLLRETTDTLVFDTSADARTYYYRVKAYSITGESVLSTPAVDGYSSPAGPPGIPTSAAASDTIASHIEVSWERPADGSPVGGYAVYRADTQEGEYAVLDSTSDTRYLDYVPLTFPTTYWYRVKAYNDAGMGAFGAAVEGSRNQ
jgi:fibronectin type 3 domain-containing protein